MTHRCVQIETTAGVCAHTSVFKATTESVFLLLLNLNERAANTEVFQNVGSEVVCLVPGILVYMKRENELVIYYSCVI